MPAKKAEPSPPAEDVAKPRRKAAATRPKKPKPGALVERVYATIDSELQKLEQQKGLTSQDRERA